MDRHVCKMHSPEPLGRRHACPNRWESERNNGGRGAAALRSECVRHGVRRWNWWQPLLRAEHFARGAPWLWEQLTRSGAHDDRITTCRLTIIAVSLHVLVLTVSNLVCRRGCASRGSNRRTQSTSESRGERRERAIASRGARVRERREPCPKPPLSQAQSRQAPSASISHPRAVEGGCGLGVAWRVGVGV